MGDAAWPTKRPDFSGVTILIVEDDPDSRAFLGELLRSCGAAVLEADNVRTAQSYVGTLKVNLIVTDLALPGIDGVAFLQWLREQPQDKGGAVAVVVVTAFYERYPPTEVTGWAAYFRKPLDIDDFLTTIAALLNRPT